MPGASMSSASGEHPPSTGGKVSRDDGDGGGASDTPFEAGEHEARRRRGGWGGGVQPVRADQASVDQPHLPGLAHGHAQRRGVVAGPPRRRNRAGYDNVVGPLG